MRKSDLILAMLEQKSKYTHAASAIEAAIELIDVATPEDSAVSEVKAIARGPLFGGDDDDKKA
jgi:hypothetical protein